MNDTLDLMHVQEREIDQLSGGELQRFAIAVACIQNADMYMFDEPSSYLDVRQRLRAAEAIRSLCAEDKYVIAVEHDLSVLDYLSDFVCCLYGKPGAYGVVTAPFSVREGINIFLAGFVPTENLRFRQVELSFKVAENVQSRDEEEAKRHSQINYPDMTKQLGDFKLAVRAGGFSQSEIIVMLGQNGTGKCFAKDTPFIMFDGTIKTVQDIQEGEQLMGDDGSARVVQVGSLHHGVGQLYQVKPHDHTVADAHTVNGDHILVLMIDQPPNIHTHHNQFIVELWQIIDSFPQKQYVTFSSLNEANIYYNKVLSCYTPLIYELSVETYLYRLSEDVRQVSKLYRPSAMEFAEQQSMIKDVVSAELCGDVCSDDLEQISWSVGVNIGKSWMSCQQKSQLNSAVETRLAAVANCLTDDATSARLLRVMDRLDVLQTKRIPSSLLTDAINIRSSLLAGILNAAANFHNDSIVVDCADELLAQDIKFLARSLGIHTAHTGTTVRMTMESSSVLAPFSSTPIKHTQRHSHLHSFAFSVAPVGDEFGHYYGFTVSGNGRFLLGDFTVTHNTTFIRMLAGQLAPDGGVKVPPLNVSYKPQKINPKSEGTVQMLLHSKIPRTYQHPQFVTDVMKPLDIDSLMDNEVKNLSGGELQRVAITLALGKPADIYLIDEPSAYLDSEQRIHASKVIKRFILHAKKTAFIVEHDFIMATYLADRVIVYEGSPARDCVANTPQPLLSGMNQFLKDLAITFRRDPSNHRPRINKMNSVKDKEQKSAGTFFYLDTDEAETDDLPMSRSDRKKRDKRDQENKREMERDEKKAAEKARNRADEVDEEPKP